MTRLTPFLVFGEGPGPNTDPARPLYPHSSTGAAAKLAALLGLDTDTYLARVARYNLLHDGTRPLDLEQARSRAESLMCAAEAAHPNAHIVFLGGKALNCAPRAFRKLKSAQSLDYVLYIPHTSGANRWYNSAENTRLASLALQAHLGRAGGLTLPTGTRGPVEAWAGLAERGICPPPPPGPGMRLEEQEWLLRRWDEQTRFDSSTQEILACPAAKRLLREQGVRLVPVLIEKLRTGAPGQVWGWFALLEKITRRKPFPSECVDDLERTKTFWIKWYDAVK